MKKTKMSEQELAARVIAVLNAYGWECYQEIQLTMGGCTLDILAVQRPLFIAIECKLRMNFELLLQARGWRPYAHYVYAVVPGEISAWDGEAKIFKACGVRLLGLGEIESRNPMFYGGPVDCWVPMNRHAKVEVWKPFLRPEYQAHTDGCAGCAGAPKLTHYRCTIIDLTEMVRNWPGIKVKTLVQKVPTHWASPKAAAGRIIELAAQGVLSEFHLEQDDSGEWCAYPNAKETLHA